MADQGRTERRRNARLARQVRIAHGIGRFLATATRVRPGCRPNAVFEMAEYSDPALPGLRLRIETPRPEQVPTCLPLEVRCAKLIPRFRWFWKRAGLPTMALCAHEETAAAAREDIQRLRTGDESAIVCAYLENDGGRQRFYYHDGDLLQELGLRGVRELIAQKRSFLRACERERRATGRRTDLVTAISVYRRELAELEKMVARCVAWTERNGLRIKVAPKAAELRRAA